MAYRSRRRGGIPVPPGFVGAVGAGLLAAALTGHHADEVSGKTSPAAAKVIAYARAQLGVPYVWGGESPYGYDCSGLAQAAYAAAGITIERTSEQQWASEQHVSDPVAGDLVFFAGSDGTPASPGHVGIVVDPAKHLMIDAYTTGTNVEYDTYGPAAVPGSGLDAVVGFTDPAGGA